MQLISEGWCPQSSTSYPVCLTGWRGCFWKNNKIMQEIYRRWMEKLLIWKSRFLLEEPEPYASSEGNRRNIMAGKNSQHGIVSAYRQGKKRVEKGPMAGKRIARKCLVGAQSAFEKDFIERKIFLTTRLIYSGSIYFHNS